VCIECYITLSVIYITVHITIIYMDMLTYMLIKQGYILNDSIESYLILNTVA